LTTNAWRCNTAAPKLTPRTRSKPTLETLRLVHFKKHGTLYSKQAPDSLKPRLTQLKLGERAQLSTYTRHTCAHPNDEGSYASTRRVGGPMLTRLPMARALTARRLTNPNPKLREAHRPASVACRAFPLNNNFAIPYSP
jgi:hypothetical protein